MNISELLSLADWVLTKIEDDEIPRRYQDLIQVLTQNIQPNTPTQSFEAQRLALTQAISKVSVDDLSTEQYKFLQKVGLTEIIGARGSANVESIFRDNSMDLASANQKFNKIYSELKTEIDRFEQIKEALQDCVPETEEIPPGRVQMHLHFSGDAGMSNVVDFRKWGVAWYEIGRGLAMANGRSPEEVQIVGASSGSVILYLLVADWAARSISSIISSALRVAKEWYEFREIAQRAREKKAPESAVREIEDHADLLKERNVGEIVESLAKSLNLHNGAQGDKIKALEKAVTQLVGFVLKGGEIDLGRTSEDAESAEKPEGLMELKESFEQIRRLRREIKLLSSDYRTPSNESESEEDA